MYICDVCYNYLSFFKGYLQRHFMFLVVYFFCWSFCFKKMLFKMNNVTVYWLWMKELAKTIFPINIAKHDISLRPTLVASMCEHLLPPHGGLFSGKCRRGDERGGLFMKNNVLTPDLSLLVQLPPTPGKSCLWDSGSFTHSLFFPNYILNWMLKFRL